MTQWELAFIFYVGMVVLFLFTLRYQKRVFAEAERKFAEAEG